MTLGKAPLLAVMALGCASADRTTWDRDRADGLGPALGRRAAPLKQAPKKAVTIRSKTDPESTDYEALSRQLELEILRFTSQRKALAATLTAGDSWPPALRRLFAQTLDRLEKGYRAPPGTLVRRLLIQTRVSLEVELDLSQRRFGPAPLEIKKRITGVYGSVAAHLRAKPKTRDQVRRSRHRVKLGWPLSPLIVTSPFGYRRDPILGSSAIRFHSGVDLGGRPGDIVIAAGPGRVTYAGWLGGHGRTVVVQHAGGYMTMYAHLRSVLVTFGSSVLAGSAIGMVGNSGRSTGPHLHFEVRHGGTPIDPLDIVGVVLTEGVALR